MATDDFKRIFESLRVAVVIADAKGAISYGNSAFGQLVSGDARGMNGVELNSLFAKEDRKRVQQNVARVGEGKAGSAFFDAMLTPKDRTPHWVSVALQPSLDAKDKAEGVIAILQDIGTQRETDEALNLVSARLLAAAENSPVAIMIETAPGDIDAPVELTVRRCLGMLEATERRALLLAYRDGLSYAELGAVLGVSAEAAKACMGRALVRMRQCLDDER